MNKFSAITRGAARVMDLFGTLSRYNVYSLSQKADFYAIKHDWQIVGRDMKLAIKEYERTASSRQKARLAK